MTPHQKNYGNGEQYPSSLTARGRGEALLNRNMYLTADNYDRAIKAVVDFIKEDGRFGNKIGLMGVSYGGYLAASGAIYCGDDIKALVSRRGMFQNGSAHHASVCGNR